MIQPTRGFAERSGVGVGIGTLGAMEANLAGVSSTSGFVTGGCGTGAGEIDDWTAGSGSFFTVATVMTEAGLAGAGAGTSCRLSEGSGDNAAVFMLPGCTVTVFTAFGLIGSVEPGCGASEAERVTDATRTGADPVRSTSLGSLRACAVSHPSTTGGAVRLTAAMLMLLSIKLRTRASR